MQEYRKGVTISVTELKQNLSKYIEHVEGLDDVVITRNGHKVARLTPYVTDIERYFTLRERDLDYQYGGKKVSYQEFIEISDKSTLRMEFINGEIHLLGSPRVAHQQLLGRLHLAFQEYFQGKDCHVFFAPFDVHFFKKDIKDPDVMQPDLLVACDLEDNLEKDRYMGTPTLVIEVLSPSTQTKDMIDKLNTYALSGVQEYWIVDESQKRVLLYSFRELEINQFEVYSSQGLARSLVFEGLELDIDYLFANLL